MSIETIEKDKLKFDREKHHDEIALRNRELELKQAELRKSHWRSPLFVAIVAGVVGLFSNAVVALINGNSQRSLEREKATATRILAQQNTEADRILEAIKTGDPDKAATNLMLLVKTDLISKKTNIEQYLKDRKEGEGPSLPAPRMSSNSDQPLHIVKKAQIKWDQESYFSGHNFGNSRGLVLVRIIIRWDDGQDSIYIFEISEDSITKWTDELILFNFTENDRMRFRELQDKGIKAMESERGNGYHIDYVILTSHGIIMTSEFRKL